MQDTDGFGTCTEMYPGSEDERLRCGRRKPELQLWHPPRPWDQIELEAFEAEGLILVLDESHQWRNQPGYCFRCRCLGTHYGDSPCVRACKVCEGGHGDVQVHLGDGG